LTAPPSGRAGSPRVRLRRALERRQFGDRWCPYRGAVLRAVVFDVDFTIARRHGLELDPARYEEARAAAFGEVKRHPELDHDEEIWVLFTERIIRGMGGAGDTYAAAVEMEGRWAQSAHFELYDD